MSLTLNALLCIALGLYWAEVGMMAQQSPLLILGAWLGAHIANFGLIYTLVSTGVLDVAE